MSKNRYENRKRSSIILDAGYVSIASNDRYQASKAIGLHGIRLFCVIFISLFLFFISCINLTCMIWLLYKLDWSPFYKNGSKVFRIDKLTQQVELFSEGTLEKPIYTKQIHHTSSMKFSTKEQIDIYGDHNSILFDENQISLNTDSFDLNNQILVDFTNLYSYKFPQSQTTKIHFKQINTPSIHHREMNLSTEHDLTISNVNNILISSQHLRIESDQTNLQSLIRFNNNQRTKHSRDYRQKTTFGNLDIRSDTISLHLPQAIFIENSQQNKLGVYRICICNTTFLLLRSFSHQPCPLC